eukprot:sb/3469753/
MSNLQTRLGDTCKHSLNALKRQSIMKKFSMCDRYSFLYKILDSYFIEPTQMSKQPIRTRYLGHVTGYQPIRVQYFLIRSVPDTVTISHVIGNIVVEKGDNKGFSLSLTLSLGPLHAPLLQKAVRSHARGGLNPLSPDPVGSAEYITHREPTETSKQSIRTRYLGHVTGYHPIRHQQFLIRSVPVTHKRERERERERDREGDRERERERISKWYTVGAKDRK